MNALIPIVSLFAIATVCGLFAHTRIRRFWFASIVGAAATTVVWVSGIQILFAVTAPSEMGGLVWEALGLTCGIGLAVACAIGWVIYLFRGRTNLEHAKP